MGWGGLAMELQPASLARHARQVSSKAQASQPTHQPHAPPVRGDTPAGALASAPWRIPGRSSTLRGTLRRA